MDRAVSAEQQQPPRFVRRGVASVSLASLFSDAGHEITTSLMPTFVVTVLKSSSAALGVIEGISDALLGVAQLICGPFANDLRARRDIACSGYLVTAAATGAVGLAATVWQAGLLRAAAWIGRGARSPARDALLASMADERSFGLAYGMERAGDNLGAVIGPLLAALLLSLVRVRDALYLAAIPGVFAALAIIAAAREARSHSQPPGTPRSERRARTWLSGLQARAVLRAGLARPASAIALFECGNCATTLLILRATDLLHREHRSATSAAVLAVVLYAANNLFGALVALAGGRWIDCRGPREPFAAGALLFIAAYVLFALIAGSWEEILGAFILSGAATGLAEPSESAYFALRLPDNLRGSGFGLLGGIQAAGDLVASGVLGLIWLLAGPTVAFLYAAAWMAASLLTSTLLRDDAGREHGDRRE